MKYEALQILKDKNCPQKCGFSNLINRQMCVKINRKAAFLLSAVRQKVKILLSPTLPPLYFCCHSLKLLSPTFPKLMNWILLSPPPLSSDPDTPKFGMCTSLSQVAGHSSLFYFNFLIQNYFDFVQNEDKQ